MWTPSLRTFRVLIAVSLALQFLLIAEWQFDFLPKTEDERTALRMNNINAAILYDQAVRLYYLFNGMYVIGFLGMWFLHDLGRWSVLAAVCGNVLSGFAYGVSVWTPAQTLIASIGEFLTDLTLAIAFLSPIAKSFARYDETPPETNSVNH